VGGRGRPQDDSTEGERTQSFPCIIRCETVRFRLLKYRNGGQLWVVNVFSYTIHAQTDCWPSGSPLLFPSFFPSYCDLSSQLFCVHYKNEPWPLLGFLFLKRFSTNFFLQGEVVSLTPNPQPEGPGLRIYTPGDRVPRYTPGHWVSRVLRYRHFLYPLTSAPERGVILQWHYTARLQLYNGASNIKNGLCCLVGSKL
jgi:hypothetical protein